MNLLPLACGIDTRVACSIVGHYFVFGCVWALHSGRADWHAWYCNASNVIGSFSNQSLNKVCWYMPLDPVIAGHSRMAGRELSRHAETYAYRFGAIHVHDVNFKTISAQVLDPLTAAATAW